MTRGIKILMTVLAAAVLAGCAQQGATIPAHPDKLVYPEMKYQVAPPEQFRHTLANGMVVYIAEDRMLPTFDLTVTVRAGSAFEPPAKAGLAALVGEELRDGGTESRPPAELDEQLEFLAANLRSSIGETRGQVSLSCLSKDIDAALVLLMDVMQHPRFDEERFRKAVDRTLQNIKRRNDATESIEDIEWGFLMTGPDHFSNRYPSSATLKAITREDLIAFHKQYYHPGNMLIAVSGDFDKKQMLAKLEKAFGGWSAGTAASREVPKPQFHPQPGVYVVAKEGVNQGRLSIGHQAAMRGSPDEFALLVMDAILGSGGFRARLPAKVRSDEGLAYTVASDFDLGVYYPGDFRCYLQTKSNACAYATRLVVDEIKRIRTEPVPEADLKDAIAYYVENFPQYFPTKMALLGAYVSDEYTGRDTKYWPTYVENIRKVTTADVQRVAQQYLHPDQLVILAVGDADAIVKGGYEKAPELLLESFGKIQRLPLRDPDTMKR